MISTSSWILARCKEEEQSYSGAATISTIASEHSSDYISSLLSAQARLRTRMAVGIN
jgi:hypothetical protein